jgi:hypothetical protein
MAVETGAPPARDEKTMAALMATQEAGSRPQQWWRLGHPLQEIRRRWRPFWLPRRQAGRPQQLWKLVHPLDKMGRRWRPQGCPQWLWRLRHPLGEMRR